jgi:hypothetical protein
VTPSTVLRCLSRHTVRSTQSKSALSSPWSEPLAGRKWNDPLDSGTATLDSPGSTGPANLISLMMRYRVQTNPVV